MTRFNDKNLARRDVHSVGSWFPIKQHRYETGSHPALISKGKKEIKVKLSHAEQLMLEGLANTFGQVQRDALRIAVYEACKVAEDLQRDLKAGDPLTTFKGHQSRDKQLIWKVDRDLAKQLTDTAKHLKVANGTLIRASLHYVSRGVKSDSPEWRKISGCPKIKQIDLANQWKEDQKNQGKWIVGTMTALDTLRQAQEEAWDEGYAASEALYEKRGECMMKLKADGLGSLAFVDDQEKQLNVDLIDGLMAQDEADHHAARLASELEGITDQAMRDQITRDHYLVLGEEPEFIEIFIATGEWPWETEEREMMEGLDEEDFDDSFLESTIAATTQHTWDSKATEDARERTEKINQATDLIDSGDVKQGLILAMGETAALRYLKQQGIE